MKTCRRVGVFVLGLAIVGMVGAIVIAAEHTESCGDFALRLQGGFFGCPVLSADLQIAGAIGFCDVSLAVWMDINMLPSIAMTLDGELRLTREWLSLSLMPDESESWMDMMLKGQAAPPAWLLYEGVPTLIGGITTTAETGPLMSVTRSELTLSPFLTGVILAGSAIVSPSLGIDVAIDSENKTPNMSGSHLATTVTIGTVIIANTVQFEGLFDAFSSLVVSIAVPDWGITMFGSLIASDAGSFLYRLSVSYQLGNMSLLPVLTGQPGMICAGGVCF